ncbi:MAG: hypothetical protein WCF57_00200 [Pyrinomonadaceae bacterium]
MSGTGIVRRIRLGDDVQTYCGRCKEERLHQVVALNNQQRIERVICRTCNSNHLYRDRQAGSQERTRRAPGKGTERAASAAPAVPEKWRHYSAQEAYTEGELISHSKFGMGRVVASRAGKVDVKFGATVRTLLQNG